MSKKIYFKVYQDKDSIDGMYYVDTIANCIKNIPHWLKEYRENDECLPPIFEIVEMTDEEFENLPEFEGF